MLPCQPRERLAAAVIARDDCSCRWVPTARRRRPHERL